MSVDAQFLKKVDTIATALDRLDYFQILGIGYDANPDAIRAAYHRQARRFHPDRYQHLNLPKFAEDLTRIAKRISEAYVILRDDQKRVAYAKSIQGEQRGVRLRFLDDDEQQERVEREAETGRTPQVRQFYHTARLCFANSDMAAAVKNLRMALMYEPDNEHIKQLLAEWTASKPA